MAIYSGPSIVDYLKSVNEDSSYAARAKRAAQMGIQNYSGTAAQNTQMLNALRSQTAAPAATTTTAAPAAPVVDPDAADKELARQIRDGLVQPAQTTQTTQQITAPTSAAISSLENIDPSRQRINELVSTLISGITNPTPFDPATSTGFQAAKGELEKQAQRSYGDVMAGYLGNQSGNFNTAAQQIASSAQNDLLGRIPALQAEYENLHSNQQRQKLSDTSNVVNLLLGIDEMDYGRKTAEEDKQKQSFLETIGQYSSDYQKEINRRTGIDPNDWTIPYLKAARAEKIAGMDAAKLSAQEKDIKQAFDSWKMLGVASPEIAAVLGVPQGAKTVEYLNMETARAKAASSGTSSGNAENSRDFGILYQAMFESGNPTKWLTDNADWLGEYLVPLQKYAKETGTDTSKLFSSATPEQKSSYEDLKKIYLGEGALGVPKGGSRGQFLDNPEAALLQLRSNSMNQYILGPLYTVLEDDIKAAIEAKKNSTTDAMMDTVTNEMLGSPDPFAVIEKYKGQLTSSQIDQLAKIAKQLMTGGGSDYSVYAR